MDTAVPCSPLVNKNREVGKVVNAKRTDPKET